ncbi:MAG: flavodoxin [Eubacteriales bacterium]|jgi:flavodoxin
MKKSVKLITGIVLAAGLFAGCGSSTASQSSAAASSTGSSTESSDTSVTAVSDETSSESVGTESTSATSESSESIVSSSGEAGSSVLVVYYSATGNTEAVAQTIADATGADIFEITPVEPYTDDDLNWTDDNIRVSQEHNDESLQDQVELTTTTVDGWDSYDTVFFGYPIWWGDAAWPVNQFVQNNDFSGKTVIPFCTSSSSGIGESGELLAEMAGTGNWLEGQRFSSQPDDSEVTSWAQSMITG